MNKKRNKQKHHHGALPAQIRAVFDQQQVPAAIAVQILAGVLDEAEATVEQREQWQADRQSEISMAETAPKRLKSRRAKQISRAFVVPENVARQVLNGKTQPNELIKIAQETERKRQEKVLVERRQQWLTQGVAALQAQGIPEQMARDLLNLHISPSEKIDLDASPIEVAGDYWQKALHNSGFAIAEDLIDAWQCYHVWTVPDLARAKEKQLREANAGMLPEQVTALCANDRIEDTLHKLFHLNHWAKSRNLLLYVDRQGLYEVKARLLQEAYSAGKIKAISYVGSDTPFEPFAGFIGTDAAAEWFGDVLDFSFKEDWGSDSWGPFFPLARQMYLSITGQEAMTDSRIDQRLVEDYISERLEQLAHEATVTHQPIPISELQALFLNPGDIESLDCGVKRDYPLWEDLDDDDLRPIDPEALSLVGFRYESPSARYMFHLPLRVAERFVSAGDIEALRGDSERTREAGEFFGREINEDESLTHPIRELLVEFGVEIDLVCPQGLVDKDTYVAEKQMRRSYYNFDFDDGDGFEDDEEYFFGDLGQEKKRSQLATFPVCPLCAVEIDAADRLTHWQESHPDVQSVTVSRAAWLLDLSKTGFETLDQKADFRGEGNARYWRLDTLQEIADQT